MNLKTATCNTPGRKNQILKVARHVTKNVQGKSMNVTCSQFSGNNSKSG